eukprot:m.251499 g.251499  ORF g.251499 m.251499 type:complete len:66 (+) comp19539_c0_seq3:2164-2361(+)
MHSVPNATVVYVFIFGIRRMLCVTGTPRSVSGTPTFLHMLDTSDISRDPGASSPANNGDDMPSWF